MNKTTTTVAPVLAIYRVLLRQIVTRARLAGMGILAALWAFIGWAAGRGNVSVRDAVGLIGNLGLAILVPVGALIFATAALADLREDQTLVYLWHRPMPSWVVPVAAFAAAVTALAPITLTAALLTAVLLGVGNSLPGAAVLAVALGTVVYTAVFVTFGLYVKRTLLWGLVYILIWEGFIAGAGQVVARFAIRAYTRSIVARITDVEVSLADFSLATSILVGLFVVAAALFLGARRYRVMDID